MPKNILKLVKQISEEEYLVVNTHDILKDEEFYTFGDRLYLIDLDGAHIQDEKKNNIYYFDLETGEIIYLKNIPNPTKFYNPFKLDMFIKKKILQQLWGKIREQGTGSQYLVFILLGIGVGFGIGFVASYLLVPHQTIVQIANSTTTIPTI